MTEPISNETRQALIRVARRLQNLREKEENNVAICGTIVETYLRAEREVLLELVHEWQPTLEQGRERVAPVRQFIGTDLAEAATEPVPMGRATRITGEAVAHYIMDHDGAVAVDYIVRDLFPRHKNAKANAMSILKRLASVGTVNLDYDGEGRRIAVLRRWPRKED